MFSDEFKAHYQVCGLVETHTTISSTSDMCARSDAQGFDAHANPAMNYQNSTGNHGGEVIFTSKNTFSIPIDPSVLDSAKNENEEPCRFSAVEVRFGHMSILNIVAYFWCGEGLSARNWAIL